MPDSNTMLAALSQVAAIVTSEIRNKLNQGKYPDEIEGTVVSDPPKAEAGGYSVEIRVGGPNALMAVAFEYGSGIHRTRGKPPGTYEIWPKAGKFNGVLAFMWPGHDADFPRGGKYVGPGKGDKLLFWYVDHPGIEARPFVQPSVEETKDQVRALLGQSFKVALLEGTRALTVIEVR